MEVEKIYIEIPNQQLIIKGESRLVALKRRLLIKYDTKDYKEQSIILKILKK